MTDITENTKGLGDVGEGVRGNLARRRGQISERGLAAPSGRDTRTRYLRRHPAQLNASNTQQGKTQASEVLKLEQNANNLGGG